MSPGFHPAERLRLIAQANLGGDVAFAWQHERRHRRVFIPDATFDDASDVRSKHDPAVVRRKLEEAERIRRDEVPEGVDMATWALAWCLQHPAVSCVIPGCRNVEQVEANARAADLELVRDDHPQAVAGAYGCERVAG